MSVVGRRLLSDVFVFRLRYLIAQRRELLLESCIAIGREARGSFQLRARGHRFPQLRLQAVDMGGGGSRDTRDLGVLRLRRLVQARVQLVQLLREGVPLGQHGLQLGFQLPNAQRERIRGGGGGGGSWGGGSRSGAGRGSGSWGGTGGPVQAGADPELGLQQAAVLLGEGVPDRTGGDEAQLDQDRPERPPAAALLVQSLRELLLGEEALFDHELA